MKALYPFVGGSATSHKFNLKDPRDLDAAFRLQFNGGWTHTSTGAFPNGTNAWANTYLNELAHITINDTQLDKYIHLSVYSRTNTPSTTTYGGIGVDNSYEGWGSVALTIKRNDGLAYGYSRGNIFTPPVSMADSRGLFMINRQSDTSLKYTKDGVVISQETTGWNIYSRPGATRNNIWLGALYSSYGTHWYDNKEESFASIGYGLTDTETSALYTAVQKFQTALGRQVDTPVYNTNGLVLNLDAGNANSYPGTGTTWFDLAAGNNGTLVNGPTYDSANGGSLLFDGINDRVSSFPIKLPDTSSKTIDVWFRSTASTRQGLCGIRDGVAISGWVFTINRTSTGNLSYFNTGQGTIEISAGITTNTWYNAVVTHDYLTGVAKIYLNGKLLGTGNAAGYNSSTFNGVIGDEDGSFTTPFKGNIPKVTMYNRVLTDTEVLNNFNSTRGRFGL
jgi:hypothetical protein